MSVEPLYDYDSELLGLLSEDSYQIKNQERVGQPPIEWAEEMKISHQFALPRRSLTRPELKEICRDNQKPVLFGYLCVMAWGGQGKGGGGSKNPTQAWKSKEDIQRILSQLRADPNVSRASAYELFRNGKKNRVSGLGSSFFTKLLYFFRPSDDCYIMDRWTVSALVLLAREAVVEHTQQGRPSSNINGGDYERFCETIENLAMITGTPSGEIMELRLFGVDAIARIQKGSWRRVISAKWGKRAS